MHADGFAVVLALFGVICVSTPIFFDGKRGEIKILSEPAPDLVSQQGKLIVEGLAAPKTSVISGLSISRIIRFNTSFSGLPWFARNPSFGAPKRKSRPRLFVLFRLFLWGGKRSFCSGEERRVVLRL